MKRIAVIGVLVAVTGCKKEAPAAPGAGAGQAPAATAAASADAGFVLTPELLDAYMRYQLAALGGFPSDAGALERADREEQKLKEVGLSDAQLQKIDEMVSTVIARRMVTQLAASPELMPDLAQMGQQLNAEQKKRLDDAMAAYKAQQQAAKDLTEERARFGSKNIDVLLTREAELTKAWTDQMGMNGLPGR